MSAHTPGPWEACSWSSVVGGGVFGRPDKTKNQVLIAQVRSNHADSVLMAAAPDLLAACELALATDDDAVLDVLRAAVKKARGE